MGSLENRADRLQQPNPTRGQRVKLHPPNRHEFSGLSAFKNVCRLEVDNGDLGASRNDGVNAASGQFVALADADDLVSANMYSMMARSVIESEQGALIVPEYCVSFGNKYHICKYYPLANIGELTFFATHPFVSCVFGNHSTFRNALFSGCDRIYSHEDWHFNAQCIAKGIDIKIAQGTAKFALSRSYSAAVRNCAGECGARH